MIRPINEAVVVDAGRNQRGFARTTTVLLLLVLAGVGYLLFFGDAEVAEYVRSGLGVSGPKHAAVPAPLPPAQPVPAAPRNRRAGAASARTPVVPPPSAPTDGPASAPSLDPAAPLTNDVFNATDTEVIPPVPLRASQFVDTAPNLPPRRLIQIELLIDQSGVVEKALLRSSPNSINDVAAISAAKGLRFQPGTRDGHVVRYRRIMWYVLPD